MKIDWSRLLITAALGSALALPAAAQTRITYKSAKSGTSYYQMGVEIAEAMKAATSSPSRSARARRRT